MTKNQKSLEHCYFKTDCLNTLICQSTAVLACHRKKNRFLRIYKCKAESKKKKKSRYSWEKGRQWRKSGEEPGMWLMCIHSSALEPWPRQAELSTWGFGHSKSLPGLMSVLWSQVLVLHFSQSLCCDAWASYPLCAGVCRRSERLITRKLSWLMERTYDRVHRNCLTIVPAHWSLIVKFVIL